ncbi:MAG: MalY/PatB family protein [Myxococcota bacterium]
MNLDDLEIERLRQRRGEKWSTYPADVLPLWVADMDFPVAEPIRDLLRRALELGDVGYPVNPTPKSLPSVFAARARERFGWEIDPQRIEVLTDVVQGLYIALKVYSEAGEGAVVQTPIYPPFLAAVHETGRRLITNTLIQASHGYEIDFDALEASLDRGTRLLLLCNPQNPTGRVFTRGELGRLAELALRHRLTVVSDEIHADLIYPERAHVPFAMIDPEVEAHTVTLTSATKAFNIAGLRCALAIFGSELLQEQFNHLPRHLRGGVNSLGLHAAEAAWSRGQPWLDEVLRYLDGNRQFIDEYLARKLPGMRYHLPEATYLAWLDCRELDLDRSPYWFFLKRARVALSDGRVFGPGGEGFVRLNFATSHAILAEALDRMAKALSG